MTDEKRPFVRVYHDDLMRDYPEVYADDAGLALFVRLLVLVDRIWPTHPELPRSAKGRGLALLREKGLVIDEPAGTYTLKGYDKERALRQQSARNAAAVRWHMQPHSEGNALRRPSTNTNTNTKEKNGVNTREGTTTSRGGLESVSNVLARVVR